MVIVEDNVAAVCDFAKLGAKFAANATALTITNAAMTCDAVYVPGTKKPISYGFVGEPKVATPFDSVNNAPDELIVVAVPNVVPAFWNVIELMDAPPSIRTPFVDHCAKWPGVTEPCCKIYG